MKRLLALLSLAALCVAVPLQAVDLTITPASFVPGPNAKFQQGIAGATITAGQPVALDSSTERYVLADANVSTRVKVEGFAANGASAGQPLTILVEDDDLTLGATLSMTAPIYVLSDTAGGVKPSADITTGDYPVVLLIAKSTTKCILRPRVLAGTAAAQ